MVVSHQNGINYGSMIQLDESQNNHADWKKPDKKHTVMTPFTSNSRKYKIRYRDRKQISDSLGRGWGEAGGGIGL